MISASKEFKEKLKKGANLVNYADITLSDGTVLRLTYKDFMIGGCQIEDKTTDGKFGVGFCIGKTLSIKLENKDERFSKYDFYQSIIKLYVAMQLDDGTIEKIRKGVYYTLIPETPGDIIEISAVDGMYKLDKDYTSSSTQYPATLQRIISDACLDCGIPIGFRQFDNMNYTVHQKPEKATYRQIISYAAQIAGYNARIDNDGYMQLIWYNSTLLEQYNYNGGNFKTYPHDTIVDGGNFTDYSTAKIISGGTFTDAMPEHIFRVKSLDVHTDDVEITGVKVVGDDKKTVLFGEEGYLIEVKNPFANGKEQEVANYLGQRMTGMVFRQFTAQVLNNPLYEPFEVVRLSDRKGNVYVSIMNSVSYTIGGYTQIACEAEGPIRAGSAYVSASAQAVVEARRNTEKQLTTYDEAVQNMNELAANMMGLFREQEKQADGSYIYYESTKPITVDDSGKCHFEPNSTVYKKNSNGFFTSTNGGLSYASGFDSQGNAVLNVLAAIGINADWINAGTISGDRILGGTLTLGGKSDYYGNLIAIDEYGKQYLKIDRVSADFTGNYFYVYDMSKESVVRIGLGGIFCYTSRNYMSTDVSYNGIDIYRDLESGGASREMHTELNERGLIFYKSSSNINIKGGNLTISNGGSLYVNGTKNRVVKTNNYQERLQYCYETSSPMFGDIGEGKTDEEGICYIFMDDMFRETINPEFQYQVFLQKYGKGDIWIEKRTSSYFVVKGTPNLCFAWELKAKQIEHETKRLEKFVEETKEDAIDYEIESQVYISNYYKELMGYESSN